MLASIRKTSSPSLLLLEVCRSFWVRSFVVMKLELHCHREQVRTVDKSAPGLQCIRSSA